MKTILLCGHADSGKTSLANFLYMYVINGIRREDGEPKYKCWLNQQGKLIFDVGDGRAAMVDLQGRAPDDGEFSHDVFGRIRCYALADSLKEAAHVFLNVPLDLSYGTDEDKASLTKYRVGDFYRTKAVAKKFGFDNLDEILSVRGCLEGLAYVLEQIDPNIFHNPVRSLIERDSPEIAVITDGRELADVEFVRDMGGFAIKLLRNPHDRGTYGENSIDSIPADAFHAIIDNRECDMGTCHEMVYNCLVDLGVFNE